MLYTTNFYIKPLIVFLFLLPFSTSLAQSSKKELSKKLEQAIFTLSTEDKVKGLKEIVEIYRESDFAGYDNLWLKSHFILADAYKYNANYKESNKILNEILQSDVNISKDTIALIYFRKGGNFQSDKLIDSALKNYQKALLISKKIKGNEDLKANINANLGGVYYLMASVDPKVKNDEKSILLYSQKAIKHCEAAIEHQKKIGNKETEAIVTNNLASIYLMQGNSKKALEKSEYVLDILGYNFSNLSRKARSSAYLNMAYAYSNLKEYKKAFQYQDKYFHLNDSILQLQKYKEISEIHVKYDAEENKKQAQIEQERRKNAEIISYALTFFLILLIVAGFILFKLYMLNKRNYQLKVNQKLLMQQQSIAQIREDQKSKLLVATLDGRLEERKKISELLHDSVSALLSAAKLHLFVVKKKIKKPSEELDKTEKIISETQQIIRDLSHKLIPSTLSKFGLETYVNDLCKKLSNSNLKLTCKIENIDRYNESFELKIHNVINELVNNIIKHSKATKGKITIKEANQNLEIIVKDNGIGFTLDEIKSKTGIGISQLIARVEALKGKVNFKKTNEFFIVTVSLPIVKN